jgi:hypothetical protein
MCQKKSAMLDHNNLIVYNAAMKSSPEGSKNEIRTAFIADLQKLSGKFGPIERRLDGTLISNDEGYQNIASRLNEQLRPKKGGIGIFIGSGGLFSMLPDLPITTALVIDKNVAALEVKKIETDAIIESDSPEKALQRLIGSESRKQHIIFSEVDKLFEGVDLTTGFIKKEAQQYGEYHWSHSSRFNQVKDALREKTIIPIVANITNPHFGTSLNEIADRYNEKIIFSNFTNVHTWIKYIPMDFIRKWPFASDAAILYASHKDTLWGDWPKMHLAKTYEDYIAQSTADTTNR